MSHGKCVRSYVALGSNLDNPVAQVANAISWLKKIPRSHVSSVASLYRTKPVGPSNQPDFINSVASIDTELSALELLDQLQEIENIHLRARNKKWGPRTLDLDLLLFGRKKIQCDRLTVPHRYLLWRNFVLYPLAEIAPQIVLPNNLLIKTHLALYQMSRPCIVKTLL